MENEIGNWERGINHRGRGKSKRGSRWSRWNEERGVYINIECEEGFSAKENEIGNWERGISHRGHRSTEEVASL